MTDFLAMAREVGLNPQGAAEQTRLTNAMAKAHSAGHTAGYKLASDLTAAQIEERGKAREFPKLVTIKLPRNPDHDPHNKVTAPCEISDLCTDSTGEHHTAIVRTQGELDQLKSTYHITRIEDI